MLCAVCLRLGHALVTPPLHYAEQPPADEQQRIVGGAYTIANGTALCREHFERLSDWQTEHGGPVSLLALLEIMSAPDPAPSQPWLPEPDERDA